MIGSRAFVRLVQAGFVGIAILGCTAHAWAATTLLNVHADIAQGRDPRVTMTFTGGVPQYRLYGNGTRDVTVLLYGTMESSNTTSSIAGHDSLKNISIDSHGDTIEVTFHAIRNGTLGVSLGSGQSLVATLALSSQNTNASRDTFGATSPVPPPPNLPAPPDVDKTLIVPLKYADVSEVVGLLVPGQQIAPNGSFTPQEQTFGSASLYGAGTVGQLQNPLGTSSGAQTISENAGVSNSLGQQITSTVGVDRRLNAIVLTGSQAEVARLQRKIALLDVPLPTVILETSIVELTDSAARDVGIDFTNNGGPIASVSTEYKQGQTNAYDVTLQASVFAQVRHGNGKIIARPRVVAQNGETAQILTGDALPIVTSIAVSGVNALSQQVQYVNVGVNLQILPRIASDGYVTSHIFSEVSSVTGYQQGYPTLSQREATTSARVKDGQSFVIGGLLQQDDIRNYSKVPGLGDLPLIGGLFRLKHETAQNTNLYIIVTPHILTDGTTHGS